MGVVFACGFLSGRLTAPRFVVVETATPHNPEPMEIHNVNRRVMNRYADDLGLTAEQVRLLRPMFEATGERMFGIPRNSEARLKELDRFHAEIDPHLTEEQRVKARAILEMATRTKREAMARPSE